MNNRIIKFRMWDTEKKGWLLPEFYHDTASSMPIDDAFEKTSKHPKELILGSYSENPKHILMQFTGLRDNNNKEIYEGDILLLDWEGNDDEPSKIEVGWHKDGGYFLDGEYGHDYIPCLGSSDFGYEVIGNIYENPDLLTETKQEKSEQGA